MSVVHEHVKNLLGNNAIADVWVSSESMQLTLTNGSVVEIKAHDINWLTYKVWPSKGDKT